MPFVVYADVPGVFSAVRQFAPRGSRGTHPTWPNAKRLVIGAVPPVRDWYGIIRVAEFINKLFFNTTSTMAHSQLVPLMLAVSKAHLTAFIMVLFSLSARPFSSVL